MKKILILAILSVCVYGFGQQTKQQKIKNLLELTGSGNMGIKVMNDFLVYFKEAYPNVPDEYWNEFMKEVSPDDLVNLVIPIYDRHFSESEIDDFVAFYQSPSGKKMAVKLPLIYAESQEVGSKWGEELAAKIVEKLESRNYSSPPPPMQSKK